LCFSSQDEIKIFLRPAGGYPQFMPLVIANEFPHRCLSSYYILSEPTPLFDKQGTVFSIWGSKHVFACPFWIKHSAIIFNFLLLLLDVAIGLTEYNCLRKPNNHSTQEPALPTRKTRSNYKQDPVI